MKSIGMVEVRSMADAILVADIMLKTASVTLVDFDLVGSGLVSVTVEGDVGAVTAAVAGVEGRKQNLGEIVSANVIPRPHEAVDLFFE